MIKVKIEDIFNILNTTFQNSNIPRDCRNLKIDDFDEWDSLGNFNLLLAIEEFYQIKFTIDQMGELNSVKDIIKALEDEK